MIKSTFSQPVSRAGGDGQYNGADCALKSGLSEPVSMNVGDSGTPPWMRECTGDITPPSIQDSDGDVTFSPLQGMAGRLFLADLQDEFRSQHSHLEQSLEHWMAKQQKLTERVLASVEGLVSGLAAASHHNHARVADEGNGSGLGMNGNGTGAQATQPVSRSVRFDEELSSEMLHQGKMQGKMHQHEVELDMPSEDSSLGSGKHGFRKTLELQELRDATEHSEKTVDQEDKDEHSLPARVKRFLHVGKVEVALASMVMLSAFMVGFEVHYHAIHIDVPEHESPVYFAVINNFLSCVFMAELLLRIVAFNYGRTFFCVEEWTWHLLDTIIVGLSLLEVAFDLLLSADPAGSEEEGSSSSNPNLGIMKTMRIARILRLVRLIRVVRFLRSLRLLLFSIMCTLRCVVWALVLLFMILYAFGILFTHATTEYTLDMAKGIAKGGCTDCAYLRRRFGSVSQSIFTLFQAVTNGLGWEELVDPVGNMGGVWIFLLLAYISFVYFAVLNVVTGVFCQSAIESADKDEQLAIEAHMEAKDAFIQKAKDLFQSIDTGPGKDGVLTAREFHEKCNDKRVIAYFEQMEVDTKMAEKLFEVLDPDGSGTIDLDEFVAGMIRWRGTATRLDMEMVLSVVRNMAKRVQKVSNSLERMDQRMGALRREANHGGTYQKECAQL